MDSLLYVAPSDAPRTAWLAAAGRFLLAAFFLFAAAKNLGGDERMAADFRRWGYPDSFRALVAAVQAVAALLLLAPSTAFLGLSALAVVLVGAIGTHVLHDPAATAASPAAFLVVVAALGAYYRPPLLRG